MKDYAAAQTTVLQRRGVFRAPGVLDAMWESFVTACESGFQWDISEYNNEIIVRDWLEALLADEHLRTWPEHGAFRRRIGELDTRFKNLALSGVQFDGQTSWWRQLVPRFAGEEMARYCRDVFGLPVQTVRDPAE